MPQIWRASELEAAQSEQVLADEQLGAPATGE